MCLEYVEKFLWIGAKRTWGSWYYADGLHTAEPLVPERSLVYIEITIGQLKIYKSPGTDQIPAELIKAGC
jgi:hypothetical protein